MFNTLQLSVVVGGGQNKDNTRVLDTLDIGWDENDKFFFTTYTPLEVTFIIFLKGIRSVCGYVFIPSPVREGTLLMEVPGTPSGASFFPNLN